MHVCALLQGPLDVSMRLSLLESVDNNFGAATAFSYVQINVDDEDYESNSSTANSVGGHLCVLAVGTARGYLTLYVVDGSTRLSFTSNTGRNLEDSADDHPKPLASLIEVDAVQITDEDGGCDEGNFAILEITPCPRYREVLLVRSRKRVSLDFRALDVRVGIMHTREHYSTREVIFFFSYFPLVFSDV